MKFDKFRLSAMPVLQEAYCLCGNNLFEVGNGFFSSAWFCPKCENVYTLKLVKIPDKNISEQFLIQSRKEAQRKALEIHYPLSA